jgi:CO/xanthine dehydrogenase FAD-binding subunit
MHRNLSRRFRTSADRSLDASRSQEDREIAASVRGVAQASQNFPQIQMTLVAGELISGFTISVRWSRSVYLKVRDRQSYEFALA